MFSGGYLEVAQWGGAPVRLHWTLPLGVFVFGHGHYSLGAFLGFVLIVLIHEVGHALVVRRQGLRVVAIDVHALGGVCRWQGNATPIGRARIAWGGVNGQLVAFAAAVGALWVFGEPRTAFAAELAYAFTTMNGYMMALNLLPVPPLDGAEAWKLPGLLRARWKARRRAAAGRAAAETRAAVERTLFQLDERDHDLPAETAAALDARLRELAAGGGASKDPSRNN
jgi:Zn-dependent protease